jgi:zinc transporter, ZIP family
VDLTKTLVLGLIAGATIVLGIPLGRIRRPLPGLRLMLNAVAVGILIFLIWDVLAHAWEPIDGALAAAHAHTGGLAPAFGYGALFAAGLAVGLLSLVAYERYIGRAARPEGRRPGSPARRLAMLIAVGIGLHNFAEGLAIGQSAASNEIALATMLVIGFGLHNATEGFGIVAPLAADLDENGERRIPSWGYLLLLALIGGGPTFVGTWVGHGFTSEAVSVVFLTLAAGSILYVVIQLLGIATKAKRSDLLAQGLLIGLLAGFITDAVVTFGGA